MQSPTSLPPENPASSSPRHPLPNAAGVDRPRVSLLLSDTEEAESPQAFVMPSLAGLTLAGAAARAATAGLHIVSAEDLNLPTATPAATPASSTGSPSLAAIQLPASAPQPAAVGTVIAQSPSAGHRVAKGDPVRITLTN